MNEETGITLAEGWWCKNCEYFEEPDETNPLGDSERCMSCGCDGSAHVAAEVVGK